jgi:hypothetical protein
MDERKTVSTFVYILYVIVEAVRESETQYSSKSQNQTNGKSSMCVTLIIYPRHEPKK